MANKFQKSVLERLEQEAARQKQKPKSKASEKLPKEKPVVRAVEAAQAVHSAESQALVVQLEEAPEISAQQEPSPKNELPILPDIGEYLRRDNQRLAKNKTFYLDNDVIESIKTIAKAQRVTDSKLVNDIMRRVLGLS